MGLLYFIPFNLFNNVNSYKLLLKEKYLAQKE